MSLSVTELAVFLTQMEPLIVARSPGALCSVRFPTVIEKLPV